MKKFHYYNVYKVLLTIYNRDFSEHDYNFSKKVVKGGKTILILKINTKTSKINSCSSSRTLFFF